MSQLQLIVSHEEQMCLKGNQIVDNIMMIDAVDDTICFCRHVG